MVARSAADDVDVVDGVDVIVVEREAVEEHVAVLDGTADSVAHGTRLFEDFLEHEIGEAAALGVFGIPIDMRGLELDRMTGRAKVLDARGPEQRELTVFEEDDVAREIHYGDDVARHEGGRLVPFGKPDDDRLSLRVTAISPGWSTCMTARPYAPCRSSVVRARASIRSPL